jgi:hypothetical protein
VSPAPPPAPQAPPPPYRITARNAAGRSENRIHSDDVARRYGFGGGLVPGVTLYGYMTQPVMAHFGLAWLERGSLQVRFQRPVYDGQEVVVTARPAPDGALALELAGPDGAVLVPGRALVRAPGPAAAAGGPPPPDPEAIPAAAVPSERPAADEVSLAPGTVLGTLWTGPDPGPQTPYVEVLAGDLPRYAAAGVLHPGQIVLTANTVLTASVRLGPWVHVATDLTNFAPVPVASVVETRARVKDRYGRRGHQFVVLDVVWLVDGAVAAQATHTAIYRLREAGEGSDGA